MTSKKPVSIPTKPSPSVKPAPPTKAPTAAKLAPSKPAPPTSNPMKSIQNVSKPISKKNVWSNKKGEQYDGNQDFEQAQLEDDIGYFQKQLQKEIDADVKKNIKAVTGGIVNSTGGAKKEEGVGLKNTMGMEKQMEKELEKMMREEMDNADYN